MSVWYFIIAKCISGGRNMLQLTACKWGQWYLTPLTCRKITGLSTYPTVAEFIFSQNSLHKNDPTFLPYACESIAWFWTNYFTKGHSKAQNSSAKMFLEFRNFVSLWSRAHVMLVIQQTLPFNINQGAIKHNREHRHQSNTVMHLMDYGYQSAKSISIRSWR